MIKKSTFFFLLTMLLLNIFSYGQQVNESFDVVIKRAMGQGIIRRQNTTFIYMAAPGQDTVKIRNEYERLIKQSGKPYTFQFDTKVAPRQNIPAKENNSQQEVYHPQPTQVNSTIKQTVIDQGAISFARQKVFGELHYTDRVENYTWVVPDGVTQIRIEAWSGGGNGYSEWKYSNEVFPNNLQRIADIPGGGGGGGAYASAIIPVEKDEKILITIPPAGGGKTLQVFVNNNTNALYLNNGADGKADVLSGNGGGGVSGGIYGRFANNVFWVAGNNGGVLDNTSTYSFDPGGKDFLGNTIIAKINIFIPNFGDGGGAAFLNNGGRGANLVNVFYHNRNAISGGFPGGGGGGGIENSGYQPARGAPGEVVIHY